MKSIFFLILTIFFIPKISLSNEKVIHKKSNQEMQMEAEEFCSDSDGSFSECVEDSIRPEDSSDYYAGCSQSVDRLSCFSERSQNDLSYDDMKVDQDFYLYREYLNKSSDTNETRN